MSPTAHAILDAISDAGIADPVIDRPEKPGEVDVVCIATGADDRPTWTFATVGLGVADDDETLEAALAGPSEADLDALDDVDFDDEDALDAALDEMGGWGIEITLRLPRTEDDAPTWPIALLRHLGRYVQGGNPLELGDTIDLKLPMTRVALPEEERAAAPDSRFRSILLSADDLLGQLDTASGRVAFLQVFGLDEAERNCAMAWSGASMAWLFTERDRLLVTDESRESLLDSPGAVAVIDEGIATDGCGLASLAIEGFEWDEDNDGIVIFVPRNSLPMLGRLLRGRIRFDRDLKVHPEPPYDRADSVRFERWHMPGFTMTRKGVVLGLNDEALEFLLDVLETTEDEWQMPNGPRFVMLDI